VSVLEWVAAVAVVIGSASVLWLVRACDLAAERPRPRLVWRRREGQPSEQKAA
jgi:hypothetical protein